MKRMDINRHFPRFGHEHHPSIAAERRAQLQRHIDAHLKAGGKIRTILFGVSAFGKKEQPDNYQFNR